MFEGPHLDRRQGSSISRANPELSDSPFRHIGQSVLRNYSDLKSHDYTLHHQPQGHYQPFQ